MKKIGIFINCSLYHKNYDILVKPDLIIHRDIFQEIFNQVNEDLPEYIVIDILYKIIHFNTDKTDILNQGNIFYHKCKMFIASQCINKSLKEGYLFAKEYRYKDKILPKKESIGTFLFTNEMKDKIHDALQWRTKLSKNYDDWIVLEELKMLHQVNTKIINRIFCSYPGLEL